jgi:peptide/nickel transport system substrate-binding protein
LAGIAGLRVRPALSADAPQQPKRGGTLVMVISGDPPTLNVDTTTGVPDFCVGSLIQEGLVRLDKNFTPVTNLAESWTTTPDGLQYTFKLVAAKWHDGKDLTSADVKFSLEQVSAKYGAKFAAAAHCIDGIDVPDPRTVVIRLKQPFGPFLFSLSSYANAAILPKHVFEGTNILANPASSTSPIGTGPFMLTERVSGEHITLARNPDYWRKDRPYLDRVVFREIPDPSSVVLALKAGEADFSYYYFVPIDQFQEIVHDPDLQVREGGIPGDHLIIFNVRRAPFNDRSVRQALLHALNREFIHKTVFDGLGSVPKSAINTHLTWAYNPDVDLGKLYPFDPHKAAAMLDAAGLRPKPDGTRFDVHTVFDSSDPNYTSLVQILQQMWGAVGVRVISQASARSIELSQVYKEWDFDVTIQSYTTAGDPALGVARAYISSAIEKAPFVNCSGYSNPEVDKLFVDGASAPTQDQRAVPYKEVQVILARDLPIIPFWEAAHVNVANRRVQGPWATGTGYEFWEDVWLES